jgi:Phage integrase family
MDRWGWTQLQPWLGVRRQLPLGTLLCVIRGATAGRRWEQSSARKQLARTAARAGVRRRFAPHQLRHAHAVEMAHEGVPLVVIQRQLGHANLGVTSIYLQGDRQLRDHRHRSFAARAGDFSDRRTQREPLDKRRAAAAARLAFRAKQGAGRSALALTGSRAQALLPCLPVEPGASRRRSRRSARRPPGGPRSWRNPGKVPAASASSSSTDAAREVSSSDPFNRVDEALTRVRPISGVGARVLRRRRLRQPEQGGRELRAREDDHLPLRDEPHDSARSRPAAALLADIWLSLNEPRTARGRTSSRSRPCGPEDDSCASVASSRAGAASAGA